MPVPSNFVSQYSLEQGRQVSVRFTYADASARAADTRTDGPASMAAEALGTNDIGSFAKQLDNDSFYFLASVGPLVWIALSTSSASADRVDVMVRKDTAGTITNGQAVRVSGWNDGLGIPLVELARADSPSTMAAIGVAIGSITDSSTGTIRVFGIVDGVDTSSFSPGDTLYISPSVAGGFVTTRPTGATDLIQPMGTVGRVHATLGTHGVGGALRPNSLPNLTSGKVWQGDGSNQPVEVDPGTGDVVGPAGGVVAGELPQYADTTGKVIEGTSVLAVDVIKRDGSVAMTGNLNLGSNDIEDGITPGGTLTAAQVALFAFIDESASVGFYGDPLSPALLVANASDFDVAGGLGAFRTTGAIDGPLGIGDWPAAAAQAIPLNSVRYVGVEWNSGTPQVVVKTTNVWTLIQEWPIGFVTRDNDGVHISIAPIRLSSFAGLVQQRIAETDPFARAAGLRLESSSLTVQRTSGRAWFLTTPINFVLFDSSASDTFDRYYQDGASGFTIQLDQTSFENVSYEDGSGTLQALTNNNRYGVRWFYMDFQTGGLSMMYGTTNNSDVAVALLENPPAALPPRLQVGNFLLGRVIFKKNDGFATLVDDVFGTDFSTGGSAGDVTGPAGGTVADQVTVYADTSGKAIAGSAGPLLSANVAVLDATRTFSKIVQSQGTDDTTVVHTLTNTGTNPGQSDELVGDRNPEGLVTAEPGTRYHRQDGVDSTEYILKSASTANTPWEEIGSESIGVTEIQTGLLSGSSAVAIGGTPTAVPMDFSAVTFDPTSFTFTPLDTDITVLNTGRYRIFLEASVVSTAPGSSTILGEIWDGGAPILEAQTQTDVSDGVVDHNNITVERYADLTGGAVVGPRFTQTSGGGSASVDPGGMRLSITYHAGSIPGQVARKTSFGVGVPAPHAIDTNSGTPYKTDGSGVITEIELVGLVNTDTGTFTVEFFFGPDGGSYTSIGSCSITAGTLSGNFVPGAPVAYPAGTTFKVDRTAIGTHPGGTSEDKARFTAIYRVTLD